MSMNKLTLRDKVILGGLLITVVGDMLLPHPATAHAIALPVILAAATLAAKGASSIFGNKAKRKQEQENKRAATEQANTRQKMMEDERRNRVRIAQQLLGGVPQTTAGGGVNTNVGMDPSFWDEQMKERTYDFGKGVPESKGGTQAFLAGLFGGIGETIPAMYNPAGGAGGMGGGMPSKPAPISWQDLLALITGRKKKAPAPTWSDPSDDF